MPEGKLIVFEGIDGAGKSTNMDLTQVWMITKNLPVIRTEWKGSPLVKPAITEGKKHKSLRPKTFSLLHAADFYDRMDKVVEPHLDSGGIVLADRYCYTAYVRDTARGLCPDWVYKVYMYARKPDLVFYFKVPIDVAVERIKKRGHIGYYEAGMDMGLSNDIEESYKIFQKRISEHYDALSKLYNFVELDGTKTLSELQKQIRDRIKEIL